MSKRRKLNPPKDLYNLLSNDPFPFPYAQSKTLDTNAILQVAHQNPRSVNTPHNFFQQGRCYPLHQALILKAPTKVIDVLCTPSALRSRAEREDDTALHLALKVKSSFEVIKLLVDKYPQAAREKDRFGHIALHVACAYNASLEVVSLLLDTYPDAPKEVDYYKDTPLHLACREKASLQVISTLLDRYPHATKVKEGNGHTPLHIACQVNASLDTVRLLFEYWPDATKEKNMYGETPLHQTFFCCEVSLDVVLLLLEYWPEAAVQRNANEDTPFDLALDCCKGSASSSSSSSSSLEDIGTITTLLSFVHTIMTTTTTDNTTNEDEDDDNPSPNDMISFFTRIKWWKGIRLVMDRYPTVSKCMNLDTNVMADFLALMACQCKLTALWEVICNEQDLLAGV